MTEKKQFKLLKNADTKYKEHNYKEAIGIYKELAKGGNSKATLKYAYMLYKGEGTKVSKRKAASYFKKLADYDDGFDKNDEVEEARVRYANMLSKGDGIEANASKALKYYNMVLEEAERSDADDIFEYGEKLNEGTNGFMEDETAAELFYEKAIELGSKKAKKKLKEIDGNLKVEIRLDQEKLKELEEKNKQKDSENYRQKANFYSEKAKNYKRALDFNDDFHFKMVEATYKYPKDDYTKQLGAPSPDDFEKESEDFYNLKRIKKLRKKYTNIVKESNELAAENYKKAADKGDTKAAAEYAEMLENGIGVEKNEAEAANYYKIAAPYYKDVIEERELLYDSKVVAKCCELLKKGIITDISKENEAKVYKLTADYYSSKKKYYESAVKEKNSSIVNRLYDEHLVFSEQMLDTNSNDTTSDDEFDDEFDFVFKSKDEQKDKKVKEKYEETIKECDKLLVTYYRKAARKGNPEAMVKYGEMLKEGNEYIQKNEKKAANYYKKAADKGNPEAMVKYGEMLEKGIEVDQDKEKANIYFKIAEKIEEYKTHNVKYKNISESLDKIKNLKNNLLNNRKIKDEDMETLENLDSLEMDMIKMELEYRTENFNKNSTKYKRTKEFIEKMYSLLIPKKKKKENNNLSLEEKLEKVTKALSEQVTRQR